MGESAPRACLVQQPQPPKPGHLARGSLICRPKPTRIHGPPRVPRAPPPHHPGGRRLPLPRTATAGTPLPAARPRRTASAPSRSRPRSATCRLAAAVPLCACRSWTRGTGLRRRGRSWTRGTGQRRRGHTTYQEVCRSRRRACCAMSRRARRAAEAQSPVRRGAGLSAFRPGTVPISCAQRAPLAVMRPARWRCLTAGSQCDVPVPAAVPGDLGNPMRQRGRSRQAYVWQVGCCSRRQVDCAMLRR